MPKIKTDNGNVVKVSLFDVLKSDKTLELEAALRVRLRPNTPAALIFVD